LSTVPLLLYVFPTIQFSFIPISIETDGLNIIPAIECPHNFASSFEFFVSPFHDICCSYFCQVITQKL
jgi:hypothetical protein